MRRYSLPKIRPALGGGIDGEERRYLGGRQTLGLRGRGYSGPVQERSTPEPAQREARDHGAARRAPVRAGDAVLRGSRLAADRLLSGLAVAGLATVPRREPERHPRGP